MHELFFAFCSVPKELGIHDQNVSQKICFRRINVLVVQKVFIYLSTNISSCTFQNSTGIQLHHLHVKLLLNLNL